jgi:hypothetical protein
VPPLTGAKCPHLSVGNPSTALNSLAGLITEPCDPARVIAAIQDVRPIGVRHTSSHDQEGPDQRSRVDRRELDLIREGLALVVNTASSRSSWIPACRFVTARTASVESASYFRLDEHGTDDHTDNS